MPDISSDGFIYEGAGRRVDPQSGKMYTREEDPEFRKYIDYFGYSPEHAATLMGYNPNDESSWGRWVEGSDKTVPFSHTLGKFIGMGALGGLGGGYLGALTGLTGAGAGGAAGGAGAGAAGAGTAAGLGAGAGAAGAGAGAGTAAALAAPTLGIAGGTALPAGLIAGTAVPGFATAGTAAGLAGAGTAAATGGGVGGGGAAATGLPAGFSGVGGAGIGGTPAIVPSLGATSAIPTASIGGTGVTTGGGGILGGLKKAYDVYSGANSKNAGVGDYVDAGLKVAGSIEQGRAADRAGQNAQIAFDNAQDIERYKLERANALTNFNAPQARTNQVAIGDILRNWQPFTYDSKTRTMTGGLSPALFSDRTKQAGDVLSKQALDAMLSGNPAGLPSIPTPRERVQGTKLDTALNVASTVGGGIEAARAVQSKKNRDTSIDELVNIFSNRPTSQVGRPNTGASGSSIMPEDLYDPRRTKQPISTGTPAPISDPYAFGPRRSRGEYS